MVIPGRQNYLRATSPKYQPDLETAKKSNFLKPAQNEAPWAPIAKIVLQVRQIKNHFFYATLLAPMPQIGQNRLKMSGTFRGSQTQK